MTKKEFYDEYIKLHKAFPHKFMTDNPEKLKKSYNEVESLPVGFMKSFVSRCLKLNDPNLDLTKAANGELRSLKELEKTKKILINPDNIDYTFLDSYLRQSGVISLIEAVQKRINEKKN